MTSVNMRIVLPILGILLCTSQLTSATGIADRGIKDRGVGIHLGTTHSSIAVHRVPYSVQSGWPSTSSDFFQVVTNERGSNTTPSCVAFTDSGVLIGEPAKDQEATNPERTICGIIRLMAKRFDDPDVQSYIKTLPYKVVDIENKPHIEVKLKDGVTKVFSPEEICAMILGKMKEIAEAYMGVEIEQASIIVHPSYYGEELWQSIHKAGKIAGIKDVYSKFSSKYAVLLANKQWVPVNYRVVVYNLGGTAFHGSVVDEYNGIYDVTAAREDMNLGGQTFDLRVMDHFTNLIKDKYKKDISNDHTALMRLRRECERAKIALSDTDQVTIKIDSLSDGILLFEENLTRETFEELNMDLFKRTVELVKQVMEEAEVEKKTPMYEVLFVGGNARIPKIQSMLKNLFGRKPVKGVNPDEALAFTGAYISSAINDKLEDRPFNPVAAPVSLGIETIGGIMKPYVEGGSLNLRAFRSITTSQDQQTTIKINVFEGERSLTKHCHYLGTIEFSDLPPAPRGVVEITVKVEVGNQWDTLVTAVHEPSQTTKSILIPVEQRFNTYEQFKQVREEAEYFCREDSLEKSQIVEAIKMCLPLGYSREYGVVDGYDFDEYFGMYSNMDHSSMYQSGLKELCKNTSMINTIPPQCDPCKNDCLTRYYTVGQEKIESLIFDGQKSSFFNLPRH